jgi:hypothetical protein
MAPGPTQNLTEMRTENISLVVKATGASVSRTCHLHVLNVLKSERLKLQETSGLVQTCAGNALHFTRERVLKESNFFITVLRKMSQEKHLNCET